MPSQHWHVDISIRSSMTIIENIGISHLSLRLLPLAPAAPGFQEAPGPQEVRAGTPRFHLKWILFRLQDHSHSTEARVFHLS